MYLQSPCLILLLSIRSLSTWTRFPQKVSIQQPTSTMQSSGLSSMVRASHSTQLYRALLLRYLSLLLTAKHSVYPLSTLPDLLQQVVQTRPTSRISTILRYLITILCSLSAHIVFMKSVHLQVMSLILRFSACVSIRGLMEMLQEHLELKVLLPAAITTSHTSWISPAPTTIF